MIPAYAALVADEITGAPDNGWTAVGVIGGAIGAAIVYGIIKLIIRRMTASSELQVGEDRYNTTGIAPELVRMCSDSLNRAAAAENRAAAAETAAQEARDEAHQLREHVDGLTVSKGLLAAELARTRQGVTDGTIPPLHDLPADIAHLLDPDT